MILNNKVYVFHGRSAKFSSAVFTSLQKAESWIEKNHLTGMLTVYPLDISVFDWATENDHFRPSKEHHNEPEFIGSFTSASQEHFHYMHGERC